MSWVETRSVNCTLAGNYHVYNLRVDVTGPGCCSIGLYRENAIAVRVIDRSAYDATTSSAKKTVVSTQRLLHLLPASPRFCALIS